MAVKRRSGSLDEHTAEHVIARELARVLVVAPPWAGWLAVLALGGVLHWLWPGGWAAASVAICGVALALLDLHLTRHRGHALGKVMAAVTSLLAGGWLAWCCMTPLSIHAATFRVWLVFGGCVAAAWSQWLHIHEANDEAGMVRMFDRGVERAGYAGLRLLGVKRMDGGRATGEIAHAGQTHDDVLKAIGGIESGAGLPPGTIVGTRHPDDAGRTKVTFADPRTLNQPIPWPGPSAPGASIAEPQVHGRYQDGTPVKVTVINHHRQIMAMTGAGKTLGAAYAELAETISRADAFVVAIDLTKGEQFLGPMRPALHYVATTADQARWLLGAVMASVKPRTDYLATQHMGNWERGCGLMHGTLWIEEAADVFKALDESENADMFDSLIPLIRAARSAGWRVVYSLHRATHDQMPTFLRGMVGVTTMGVRSADDARYGLSALQSEAECHPEMWADNAEDRGKFYDDSPSIPKRYRTMAGRYWYWGERGPKTMAAYAAQYPASARPLDEVTAPYLTPAAAQPVAAPAPAPQQAAATATLTRPEARVNTTYDPYAEDTDDPDAWQKLDDSPLDAELAEADIPIGDATAPPGQPGTPVSRDVALEETRRLIGQWRLTGVPDQPGKRHRPDPMTFTIPDLRELRDRLGKSRAWLYTILPDLEAAKEIRRNDDGSWTILPRRAA